MREILQFGSPILEQKCALIRQFDAELQNQIAELLDVFESLHKPVGLAAPQIGIRKRILLARLDATKESCGKNAPKIFINPKVVEFGGRKLIDEEECLSVGRRPLFVRRFSRIVVRAQDRFGADFTEKLDGWQARILQHEIDHLDGILVINRAQGDLSQVKILQEIKQSVQFTGP